MYKDQLAKAGLYWSQLADRGPVLKALNTPKLGDSLLKTDGTPWMTALAKGAPRLNWDDLTQSPALPLGSWLKTDPWDDRVHQLNAKLYAPLNPRDKMPLEVTPVYFRLQRYDEAQSAAKNAAPAQPAGNPAAGQGTGASQQPAGGDQTAPQQNEGPQPQPQQQQAPPQQGGSPNPQK